MAKTPLMARVQSASTANPSKWNDDRVMNDIKPIVDANGVDKLSYTGATLACRRQGDGERGTAGRRIVTGLDAATMALNDGATNG